MCIKSIKDEFFEVVIEYFLEELKKLPDKTLEIDIEKKIVKINNKEYLYRIFEIYKEFSFCIIGKNTNYMERKMYMNIHLEKGKKSTEYTFLNCRGVKKEGLTIWSAMNLLIKDIKECSLNNRKSNFLPLEIWEQEKNLFDDYGTVEEFILNKQKELSNILKSFDVLLAIHFEDSDIIGELKIDNDIIFINDKDLNNFKHYYIFYGKVDRKSIIKFQDLE